MWRWATAVLDLVFPPACVLCGGALEGETRAGSVRWRGHGLCETCARSLPWPGTTCCPTCARPMASPVTPVHVCGDCLLDPPPFASARALLIYREEIFQVIHQMKYGPKPYLARFFGELMGRVFAPAVNGLAPDGLLPVPLHPKRLRQRGFNQASLMARRIERHTGIPVREEFMERSRWTPPQVGLSRADREANVRGAFRVRDPHQVRGKRWLLVDDVFTTGSTLREAAKVLRRAGASQVHVVVLARVL